MQNVPLPAAKVEAENVARVVGVDEPANVKTIGADGSAFGLVGTTESEVEIADDELRFVATEPEQRGPAWLYASQSPARTRNLPPAVQMRAGETLQDSRQRVAEQWFALKGAFVHSGPELPAMQPVQQNDGRLPVLVVFSLAGGVGKTNLVATLGRALAAQGESVLLADTTSRGVLPFYFGMRQLQPGVVQSFSPPESVCAPISLALYDAAGCSADEQRQKALADQILRDGQGNQRVLVDLSSGSNWLVRRMADQRPIVLVPMNGDMSSVISLHAVERIFQGVVDSDGRPVLPFYVLNEFDESLALHLDVREVLRQQLGDRLLKLSIRRSPAVSEALAEGMTVMDYAPFAPVSRDFTEVALWLRSISPAAVAEPANALGREA